MIRLIYGLSSLFALIVGILIYILFRDLSNIIFFSWVPKLEIIKAIYIPLEQSIISNILIFNIPDMLWFISGILFIRFIWYYNIKIQNIYIICFYFIGVMFEVSQVSKIIPGTFDWMDLLFMGIGAFIESLLYKFIVRRRFV